jgi:glycine cleavage system H protein
VAQRELGELVHVELPEVGEEYSVKSIVSTVESAKSAADVYNIVDGEVIEVNSKLSEDATIVNYDAEGAGWIMKVKVEYPW